MNSFWNLRAYENKQLLTNILIKSEADFVWQKRKILRLFSYNVEYEFPFFLIGFDSVNKWKWFWFNKRNKMKNYSVWWLTLNLLCNDSQTWTWYFNICIDLFPSFQSFFSQWHWFNPNLSLNPFQSSHNNRIDILLTQYFLTQINFDLLFVVFIQTFIRFFSAPQ